MTYAFIKILALVTASVCVSSAAEKAADTLVTSVIDGVELQVALSAAAGNQQPDIINIGEGVIDVSVLGSPFLYRPERKSDGSLEENFPIWIRGAGKDKTFLDGGGTQHILYIVTGDLRDDMNATIRISDITFRNTPNTLGANAALSVVTNKAGATIDNCSFYGCRGDEGALSAASINIGALGGLIVESCSFDSCCGGLHAMSGSSVSVMKSVFRRITDYQALEATCSNGLIAIDKCSFENCRQVSGNAVADCSIMQAGNMDITNNSFAYDTNGALSMLNQHGNIKIAGNTFDSNENTEAAAVGATVGGDSRIVASGNYFLRNRSTNNAAAYLKTYGIAGHEDDGSSIMAYNNVFGYNHSGAGAAGLRMETQMGTMDLINNTFAFDTTSANQCGEAASVGVYLGAGDAMAALVNNIIWGGVCGGKPATDILMDGAGANVLLSHNLIGKDSVAAATVITRSSNLSTDPNLDTSLNIHSGSVVIDAGDNDVWVSLGGGSSKDILGHDRIVDGLHNGTAVVDIGAYEYTGSNSVRNPWKHAAREVYRPSAYGQWYTIQGRRGIGKLPHGNIVVVLPSAGEKSASGTLLFVPKGR